MKKRLILPVVILALVVSLAFGGSALASDTLEGDVNGDGRVNVLDLGMLGLHWGERGEPGWIPEDIYPDGWINICDLKKVSVNWTG